MSELFNLARFFFKTPQDKKNIIFYAEHAGYYPYFEGTINEITKTHHICYITSDKNDPIFSTNNKNITPFYFKKLLPWFMMLINTKVFVMTLTDLHQFHLRRSINPVNYLYIFHALVSTNMMYREGAFDHYDTILCCGPHHIKEIIKREQDENLKTKKLVKGGYYRLEQIHQQFLGATTVGATTVGSTTVGSTTVAPTKTILIAPSWGEHNIVKTCGKEVIQNLLQNTDYNIILRPHPEIKKHMPEKLLEYEKLFGNNERFTLETSIATNQSMLKSDLLITDLSGIALEYSFGTERPVLFIDLPYKIKNEHYSKIGTPLELSIRSEIGTIVPPENIQDVSNRAKELIEKQEHYKQKIISLRNEHVYEFGNSSKIATKTILDLLGEGSEKNNPTEKSH